MGDNENKMNEEIDESVSKDKVDEKETMTSFFKLGFKNAKALAATVTAFIVMVTGIYQILTAVFVLKSEAVGFAKQADVDELSESTTYNQLFIVNKMLEEKFKKGETNDLEYRSLHMRQFKLMKKLGIIDEDTPYVPPE